MLKQRILTAILLAPVVLGVIYYLSTPIVAIIFGVIILLGSWEWAGLSGIQSQPAKISYVIIMALLMIAGYPLINQSTINIFLVAASIWWICALAVIISSQIKGRLPQQNKWFVLFIGYLILIPAWMSILYLHGRPEFGPQWVLFLFIIIWTADIGAYFAGRALGRHKLADKISPGKSWEGVFGGLAAVLVIAMLILPRLIGHEFVPAGLVLLCAGTALVSVIGDLIESIVKRISGKKDSNNILPGHGGIMDRIDSLTAAAPFFTAGLILSGFRA